MVKTLKQRGFTLIELLVVMAIVGTLLGLVAPRYFDHLDRARENTLRQNLMVVRDAIDKFYADQDRYPVSLDELVSQKYLRQLPHDPITQSTQSWKLTAPSGIVDGIHDLRSGAEGKARDGTPYEEF